MSIGFSPQAVYWLQPCDKTDCWIHDYVSLSKHFWVSKTGGPRLKTAVILMQFIWQEKADSLHSLAVSLQTHSVNTTKRKATVQIQINLTAKEKHKIFNFPPTIKLFKPTNNIKLPWSLYGIYRTTMERRTLQMFMFSQAQSHSVKS